MRTSLFNGSVIALLLLSTVARAGDQKAQFNNVTREHKSDFTKFIHQSSTIEMLPNSNGVLVRDANAKIPERPKVVIMDEFATAGRDVETLHSEFQKALGLPARFTPRPDDIAVQATEIKKPLALESTEHTEDFLEKYLKSRGQAIGEVAPAAADIPAGEFEAWYKGIKANTVVAEGEKAAATVGKSVIKRAMPAAVIIGLALPFVLTGDSQPKTTPSLIERHAASATNDESVFENETEEITKHSSKTPR